MEIKEICIKVLKFIDGGFFRTATAVTIIGSFYSLKPDDGQEKYYYLRVNVSNQVGTILNSTDYRRFRNQEQDKLFNLKITIGGDNPLDLKPINVETIKNSNQNDPFDLTVVLDKEWEGLEN